MTRGSPQPGADLPPSVASCSPPSGGPVLSPDTEDLEQKPTQGPPQVSSQQSIQLPEAAEGEGERPWVLPRGGASGSAAPVSSSASQMRIAACNPRECGGKWEGEQGWGGRDQGFTSQGLKQAKGKDVGLALRLEKSRDPITGRAPDQRTIHLPSPTACRTQGRPERGLPGHAGSGTLVIVEMKRIVWDSLPQKDKLHSALPGSRAAGGRGRDRMTSGCPSCQDDNVFPLGNTGKRALCPCWGPAWLCTAVGVPFPI